MSYWLWLWPLSGLLVWSWFYYSVHAAGEQNGQKATVPNSNKAKCLSIALLAGPTSLVLAIVVFLEAKDENPKVSPKFGFKIW